VRLNRQSFRISNGTKDMCLALKLANKGHKFRQSFMNLFGICANQRISPLIGDKINIALIDKKYNRTNDFAKRRYKTPFIQINKYNIGSDEKKRNRGTETKTDTKSITLPLYEQLIYSLTILMTLDIFSPSLLW